MAHEHEQGIARTYSGVKAVPSPCDALQERMGASRLIVDVVLEPLLVYRATEPLFHSATDLNQAQTGAFSGEFLNQSVTNTLIGTLAKDGARSAVVV
jgi:hypothetical protein